jgi:hypothetical protein
MEMWISHDVTNKYGGLKPATCGMFNHVPSPNPISLATFAIVFQTFWGKTENKRDMISHRSINMVNPFTNGGLFTSTLRVLGENNG